MIKQEEDVVCYSNSIESVCNVVCQQLHMGNGIVEGEKKPDAGAVRVKEPLCHTRLICQEMAFQFLLAKKDSAHIRV